MYKITRDGKAWGVIDEKETLINPRPMIRAEAIALAAECNAPQVAEHWASELPDSDYWNGGCPD